MKESGVPPDTIVGPFILRMDQNGENLMLIHENGLRFEKTSIRLALRTQDARTEFKISPKGSPERLQMELATGIELQVLVFRQQLLTGVGIELQFASCEEWARLMWRIVVTNRSQAALHLESLTFSSGNIALPPGDFERRIEIPGRNHRRTSVQPIRDLIYFHSGWQSWSHAGWLRSGDTAPATRLGKFSRPMQYAAGFPEPGLKQASDMFTVVFDRGSGCGFLAGFLSQKHAFGQVVIDSQDNGIGLQCLSVLDNKQLRPGEIFTSDWGSFEAVEGFDPEPERGFIEAAGAINQARNTSETPVGWCSWYYYFGKIREEDVRENLAWIKENRRRIPLDLVQIDDGFQDKIGDWFERSKEFQGDLVSLAESITSSGLQAGIWLAPFLAFPGSRTLKMHPDWSLRDAKGTPVNPGWGWNRFPRVLDVTHPEVLEFLARLMRTVTREWGYRYLKLDFLYAGALPGQYYDQTMTRAEAFVQALRTMREAAGDEIMMVGCGSPLGPAVGILDGMRISPDVAPSWKPRLGLVTPLIADDPGLPAARNAIRNVFARAPLHRRWWVNDPDCLLLRGDDTQLAPHEIQTLASVVAFSAGSIVISDRLSKLSEERIEWAGKLLPPLRQPAKDLSWYEAGDLHTLTLEMQDEPEIWLLLGIFNLGENPVEWEFNPTRLRLNPAREYHCFDFWHSYYYRLDSTEDHRFEIEPHGCLCLSLREVRSGPQWIGSGIHFSQGDEVRNWFRGEGELSFDIGYSKRVMSGPFLIQIPGVLSQALLGGEPVEGELVAPHVYRFYVTLDGVAFAQIGWDEVGLDD
jgi:alpha-galactosidase